MHRLTFSPILMAKRITSQKKTDISPKKLVSVAVVLASVELILVERIHFTYAELRFRIGMGHPINLRVRLPFIAREALKFPYWIYRDILDKVRGRALSIPAIVVGRHSR